MTSTVRARSAADLLVLLPYQLGYHPGPCVVVAVVRDGQVGLIQRHDLHPPGGDPDGLTPRVAERAMRVVSQESADGVILLAYEDTAGESASLLSAMLTAAAERGHRLVAAAVAHDGRWYDVEEHLERRDGGAPLPTPDQVPAVAEFVRRGVAPLGSREAVAALMTPDLDVLRAAEVERARLRLIDQHAAPGHALRPVPAPGDQVVRLPTALVAAAWRDVLDTDPGAVAVGDLSSDVLASAVHSLRDVMWRDALLAVLCPGFCRLEALDTDDLDGARVAASSCAWVTADDEQDGLEATLVVRRRLTELVSVTPQVLSAPVLTVLGQLAWWAGDGTVASLAVERALAVEPGYRLAQLMGQLIAHGIRMPAEPLPGAA